MKRFLVALIAGAAVFAMAFASAAALNLDGGTIQAGTLTPLTCQTAPVTVGYHTLVDGNAEFAVDGITLDGVEATCVGKTIGVSLESAPKNIIGFVGGQITASGSLLLWPGHTSVGATISYSNPTPFLIPAANINDVEVLIKDGDL